MKSALTVQQTLDYLKEVSWRACLWEYAQKVSEGAWVPYNWAAKLSWEIQKAVVAGGARLIINAPPQHGKSELLSHWLPTWYLDNYPDRRVLLACYGDEYAESWGRKVRDEFINSRFVLTTLDPNVRNVKYWETDKGGYMKSVGVGGSITGRGGDLILVDDPHKDWQEALSPTYRKRVIDWFKGTLFTRKSQKASFIIIQTRWHEEDLTGYLESKFPDMWTKISVPVIAEEGDFLGREEGELLCTELHNAEAIYEALTVQGSYMFAGLYQQRPAPLEGGMIKRDWIKRFNRGVFQEVTENPDEWLQSWDLTFKSTGTSYVVGQVWVRIGANCYLVDQKRAKLDFPSTLRAIQVVSSKWPNAVTKLVEDKANGPAVIATLQDSMWGVVSVSPKGSKEARLAAVSGMIESGNVHVPDNTVCDWGDDFIEEVVNFPHAANDDQVDAMTMVLDRFKSSSVISDFQVPQIGRQHSEWGAVWG
jgi:predicted phage terminase large subunit-like protein